MKVKFYSDAGHGWMAVKRELLVTLGILDKITPYSYQKGKTVYLEEDCDATTFVETCKAKGISLEFVQKYCNHSPIRNYPQFTLTNG